MQLELDESQRRVVEAPISSRRIVTAGPGAGKTATSMALIGEIGDAIGGSGESKILFVSFSRAAVAAAFNAFGELLQDNDTDVAAMTLDSLAWEVTGTSRDSSSETPIDFDGVVRAAAQKLRCEYEGELDDVVHLIVDEAQDMSAVRRELLCSLIDRLPPDAGVTVFGDPLQSIYEFLDPKSENGESAWGQLLVALAEQGITDLLSLEGEYRARGPGPKKVVVASHELRTDTAANRADILDELVSDLTHLKLGPLSAVSPGWTGSTAVLARTNADVMGLFDQLSALGVRCAWRQSGRARPIVASWVAELWSALSGASVAIADFREFATARTDVDERWFRLLLHATRAAGSAISWESVARLCATAFDRSDPWFITAPSGVLVSTIHQAKGLEWDNVAVADTRALLRPIGMREPECELLFVGLSRARNKVIALDWEMPYVKTSPANGLMYRPHPAFGIPMEVLVTPDSIRSESQYGEDDGQAVLAAGGGRVEFEQLASGKAWPSYRCRVDGVVVGATTSEFGKAFAGVLRGRGSAGWPNLGSVAMDGVESKWSVQGATKFWLKPRPLGFATVGREVQN